MLGAFQILPVGAEVEEILPHLFGALGDVGAVFQLLASLFQFVGELADGGAEGFIGGGVFVAADAAEEIAVLGPLGFQAADALLHA